jgi:hypothetical protein
MVNNFTNIKKPTFSCYCKPLNIMIKDHDIPGIGNPGPGLGQAQKCRRVILVTGVMGFQSS